MRAAIGSAAERTRELLHDLGDVTRRAQELRIQHKEQTWKWQRELEEASDEVRVGPGIEVVRAQRTSRSCPWGAWAGDES
jgi:hypothetical protein